MRLIEAKRRLSGVAGADIAMGQPCFVTYTGDKAVLNPVTPGEAITDKERIAMVDKVEAVAYNEVPATIKEGDEVIFSFQGTYEINDSDLAGDVKLGEYVEWTHEGFQKLDDGFVAGYVVGINGATVLVEYDGLVPGNTTSILA